MSSSARGRARPDSISEPDILDNLASFTRHLRAENKASSTIVTYSKAVEQFETFVSEPRAGGRGQCPCDARTSRRSSANGPTVDPSTNWSETCPDGPDVPLVPGRSG